MTTIVVDPQDPATVMVGSTRWRLWTSDAGKHYATRGGVTAAQERAGFAATLAADSMEELRHLLSAQPGTELVEG